MTDLDELWQLVEGYAHAADERDVERFAALFAEDARLTVFDPDGTARPSLVGRMEIAVIPERLRRYERTEHRLGDHVVEADGPGDAHGTTACEAHHVHEGIDTVMVITYVDQFRHTPAGWRFADREVRIIRQEDRPIVEGERS